MSVRYWVPHTVLSGSKNRTEKELCKTALMLQNKEKAVHSLGTWVHPGREGNMAKHFRLRPRKVLGNERAPWSTLGH